MIIKKYTSDTEHGAIMMAKEDLGSEAIVMNIKTIQPKGLTRMFAKTKVEITAAIDEGNAAGKGFVKAQSVNAVEPMSKETEKKEPFVLAPSVFAPPKEEEKDTTAIEKRLDSLQSLIEKNIPVKAKEGEEKRKEIKQEPRQEEDGEKGTDKSEACKQLIYDQLVQNEVDSAYAKQLIDEIQNSITPESSIDVILGNVYQKIILKLGQSRLINKHEEGKRFVFFVGPTGVGKTTTIAKIASDLKLNKKLSVAMVTADTYRIAAVEQLKTYANILGIPLKVVYSAADLKDVMEEMAAYDVVLIDTAGHSHLNTEHSRALRELLACVGEEEKEVYLVLSSTTKYRDLVAVTKAYNDIADYGLIFTKLDETERIGNIYNIRVMTNAPLSYTTYGQNVPDDISKLDPQDIARKLLGGEA